MAPGQQLGGVAQQCIADASASSRRTVLALAVVVGAMPRGLVMTSPVATPPAQTPRFRVFAWGAAFAPHQRAARWRLAEFSAGVALAQELRPADGLSSEGISPKWGGRTLLPADFRSQGTRPIVGWLRMGDGSDLKSSPLPSRAESSADVPAFASSTVYKVGKPSDRGDT